MFPQPFIYERKKSPFRKYRKDFEGSPFLGDLKGAVSKPSVDNIRGQSIPQHRLPLRQSKNN
ncbi:hypothetical protein GCM10007416_11720 [Kroppenstedtia guangzhouensis]|uniref:Uncharacterized protein n=1 Tax=Kroppenstedtia guangzhouensis TaxID=1274356 RepID=A0ABQ1GB89_9BACL|nr:hypothetical protein GCM10007416_11720 [Kroppenstedtia guangzhouensis]